MRFLDGSDGPIVGLVIDGAVRGDDVAALTRLLSEQIEKHGRLSLLMRLEALGLPTPSALWENLKFSAEHMSDIERIALVGDGAWIGPYATVATRVLSCDVRAFAAEEESEAWAWLRDLPRRYDQALQDPAAVFETPADVLSEPGWTDRQRRRVLEQWKVDAKRLEVAASENMAGGEPSRLQEVNKALAEVTTEEARP